MMVLGTYATFTCLSLFVMGAACFGICCAYIFKENDKK